MKKIIKPAVFEESEVYSDFDLTQKSYSKLIISNGYGSSFDGLNFCFDIDDEFQDKLLIFIKQHLDQGRVVIALEDFTKNI